jgi:hypothetical protein
LQLSNLSKSASKKLQAKEDSLPEQSQLRIAGSSFEGKSPNRADFERLGKEAGMAFKCPPGAQLLDHSISHLRMYLALIDSDALFPRGHRDGFISRPGTAFAMFCSHLIAYMLDRQHEKCPEEEIRHADAVAATVPECLFPNRARWLKQETEKRMLSPYGLHQQGGPDRDTTRKILEGFPVRSDALDRLIQGLSSVGEKVLPAQIPEN